MSELKSIHGSSFIEGAKKRGEIFLIKNKDGSETRYFPSGKRELFFNDEVIKTYYEEPYGKE